MQDEHERRIARSDEEDVEAHRLAGSPEDPERLIGRNEQDSEEDEVEAHRFHGDKPEEFGQKPHV